MRRHNALAEKKKSTHESVWNAVAFQEHIQIQIENRKKLDRKLHRLRQPDKEEQERAEQEILLEIARQEHLSLAFERNLLTDNGAITLSEEEWKEIEKRATLRIEEKNETDCPICQDKIRFVTLSKPSASKSTEDNSHDIPVLLSCSHVFHKTCLHSFEVYSNTKQCPMCRSAKYSWKEFQPFPEQLRQVAAIKIQSWWRKVLCLKAYEKIYKEHKPTQPLMVRKRMAEQLSEASNAYLDAIRPTQSQTDEVICDKEVESAMKLLRSLNSDNLSTSCDWKSISDAFFKRGDYDCPICLSSLCDKKATLLNCSHAFHFSCLESFERFSSDSIRLHTCPTCRQVYTRQPEFLSFPIKEQKTIKKSTSTPPKVANRKTKNKPTSNSKFRPK